MRKVKLEHAGPLSNRMPRAKWAAAPLRASALACVCLIPWGGATADELLNQALAGVERHAAAFSPVEVQWSMQRVPAIDRNRLLQMLGFSRHDGVEFFDPHTTVFRWQEGMLYVAETGNAALLGGKPGQPIKKAPYGRVYSYNGQYFYCGDLEQETFGWGAVPLLVVETMDQPIQYQPTTSLNGMDYFETIGIELPSSFGELGGAARHRLQTWLREGATLVSSGMTMQDGVTCIELVLDHEAERLRLLLASDFGFAQVLAEYTDRGTNRVTRRTTSEEFLEIRDRDLWLPRRVVTEVFTAGDLPPRENALYAERYVLRSHSGESQPAEAFMVAYERPGAIVVDYSLPEARESRRGYMIAADLEDLDGLGRGGFSWLLVVNGCVVAVCLALLAWHFGWYGKRA